MVCIIDDREDVWHFAPNLIVVKPYKYFKGTDDVNNPFATETKTSTIKTDTNSKTDDIEKTDENTKYSQVKGSENSKEVKSATTVNNDGKDSAKENGVEVGEGEKAGSNPTPGNFCTEGKRWILPMLIGFRSIVKTYLDLSRQLKTLSFFVSLCQTISFFFWWWQTG